MPSFMVDKTKNKWMDYGTTEHGDLPDLVMKLNNCSLPTAVDTILGIPQKPDNVFEAQKRDRKNVEIVEVKPLTSQWLWDYIKERRINHEVANKYLVELLIKFPYGQYPERISHVIGFKNDSGGYEMRSKSLKISNSPKNVTTIKNMPNNKIYVFEGFFSFLSYMSIPMFHLYEVYNYTILNSLSFLPQMIEFWGNDNLICGFLDNDKAGDKATDLLSKSVLKFLDKRDLYEGYCDLNDKICHKPMKKPIKSIKEFINQ
jgi:hypothetical protein